MPATRTHKKKPVRRLSAFEQWWLDPKRPNIVPYENLSPFEAAKIAFEAGRRSLLNERRRRRNN